MMLYGVHGKRQARRIFAHSHDYVALASGACTSFTEHTAATAER